MVEHERLWRLDVAVESARGKAENVKSIEDSMMSASKCNIPAMGEVKHEADKPRLVTS